MSQFCMCSYKTFIILKHWIENTGHLRACTLTAPHDGYVIVVAIGHYFILPHLKMVMLLLSQLVIILSLPI